MDVTKKIDDLVDKHRIIASKKVNSSGETLNEPEGYDDVDFTQGSVWFIQSE